MIQRRRGGEAFSSGTDGSGAPPGPAPAGRSHGGGDESSDESKHKPRGCSPLASAVKAFAAFSVASFAIWIAFSLTVVYMSSSEGVPNVPPHPRLRITPGGGAAVRGASASSSSAASATSGAENPAVVDADALSASIRSLRDEFHVRYGGRDAASAMLKRGIFAFGKGKGDDGGSAAAAAKHTAGRILRAAASTSPSDRRFVVSFGGYSVTVGRGNLFNQSYPFVLERILSDPMKSLGVELVVRNAAIGGIPSFPYGWCLPNFLGDDSDVISWDYGMNENSGTEGLEAYIRQGITMPKCPMFVMLDTKKARRDVLERYAREGALADPIAVGRGEIVDKKLLEKKEEDRPVGLRRWDEWGTPKGSPGQSNWHPKYKEHEMIGWVIAMHLLKALEEAADIVRKDSGWRETYRSAGRGVQARERVVLPKPAKSLPDDAESIPSLLHGVPVPDGGDGGEKWHMNHISCRTSFLPVVADDLTMSSVIVSGAVDDGDAMASKDDEPYRSGWVVDVGKVERDTKRRVEKSGGMGYIDMKLALYGTPVSGVLRLWLPYEGPPHDHSHDEVEDTEADHWFDKLVVCEVNEKRGEKECKMDSDVKFVVGGAEAKGVATVSSTALYLKKKVCVNVGIPADAKITRKKDLVATDGANLSPETSRALSEGTDGDVGLVVDISVKRKNVSRKNGACSIAHVVWEQH